MPAIVNDFDFEVQDGAKEQPEAEAAATAPDRGEQPVEEAMRRRTERLARVRAH